MSHNPDSENVNRLWSDRPQPSGDANIIRCLWCFTLLMNLHDFVAEPVNPVHSFHDAHTVPFCLTADHIATCHMSLCPHQASTVLVCLWTCVVWKVFGTCDDGIWSRHVESHETGVEVLAACETGFPWSPTIAQSWYVVDSSRSGDGLALVESHEKSRQDATDAVVDTVLSLVNDLALVERPGLSIK